MSRDTVNTLPAGWTECSIGHVTLPVSKIDPKDDPDREIDYIDISSIDNTRHVIGSVKQYRLEDAPSRARQVVRAGDVLFATVRPYLRNIAAVPNDYGQQIASTGFSVLRPAEGICPAFLFYKAISRDFVNALSGMQYGVSYPAVKDEHIRDQPLWLPPTEEQHRVAANIEELFSELDQGIESLKTARAQLHVYRQAVLKHAFEGKLTAQWREENTDKLEQPEQLLARIKRERAARYEQLFKEWKAAVKTWEESGKSGKRPTRPRKPRDVSPVLGADPLVDLPTAWRWTTVLEIADLVTDGTHHTPDYAGSGVPFLSVKDVRHGKVSFDDCKFISRDDHEALIQRCHPEPGDLLITKSGTIGRLAIVPDREFSLFVSVALVKIQSVQAHISSRWLRYAFEHHIMGLNIDQQIKGGLLKNYHLEDLRLARLPLCNVLEQEELVYQVEEKLSVLEELGATIDQQLVKAHALRQSVLKKAFAGQLVAQDPNDEPASVLLERIKAEKETAETNSKITKKTTTRKTTRKKRTAA